MSKTQQLATTKPYNSNNKYLLAGNIIPNQWYDKFIKPNGSTDSDMLIVMGEIVYWNRPICIKENPATGEITYKNKFKGDAWQTSYGHFEEKFGFKHEKMRRIFVKLENQGILKREPRQIKVRGQTYSNVLFIILSDGFKNSLIVAASSENPTFKKNKTKAGTSDDLIKKEGAILILKGT